MKWRHGALALALALSVGCARGTTPPEPADAPAHQPEDIRAFLDRYFGTWSQGDMEAYGALFFPEATITHLRDQKVNWRMQLPPFINSQQQVFSHPGPKPKERYTDFSAQVDAQGASVTAWWTLESPRGVSHGIDRFLLAKDFNGDWRIVALLFYDR